MTGYEIRTAAEESSGAAGENVILADIGRIEQSYPLPSAYDAYRKYLAEHSAPADARGEEPGEKKKGR